MSELHNTAQCSRNRDISIIHASCIEITFRDYTITLGTRVKRSQKGKANFDKCDAGKEKN